MSSYPADLADFRDALLDRLPLILGLIVLITFTILFLMTGSVIAPIKATLLNGLSLSVMFGALVWVFQEGHLSGFIGFTPQGSFEPSIPILMFCIAYGLSMDYEVFILARIKEEYDRTGDRIGSIAAGIQRSAPLVTAAALVLAFSFAVYATGDHLDADALFGRLKEQDVSVSRATVYNTLELLLDCDLVVKHQFGRSQAKYERAYAYWQHDHLLCLDCGAIFEFCDPRLQGIQETVAGIYGFEVAQHALHVYGHCRREGCPGKEEARSEE